MFFFFFFSSRRRHTRFDCDWSSDVCSSDLSVPPPPDSSTPCVSLASFVMTLITPLTALAPHSVAPGPLMTSIRSMSARGTSCTSQNTPEYNGVYTVRPSMSTRSLLAVVLLNPRALMAQSRELTCATCKLVARRRASGRLEAPERRMSCWVMTWMAEATCANLSGRLETEVTSRFISCSMLSFFNAAADALESGCWANPGSAKQMRPKVRSIDVAGATVLGSAIGPHLLVYHASRTSIMPGRRDVQLPAGQRAEADDDDHAPGDARDPGVAGGVVIVISLGALAGWQLDVAAAGHDRCSRSVIDQEVRTDG